MGGVRLCTQDYIELLEVKYTVTYLPVDFNRGIAFRLKSRLGIDSYEEYDTESYVASIRNKVAGLGISKIFINLANATDFARVIKQQVNKDLKVILCSHGNESGDFLHLSVRFKERLSFFQRLFAPHRLGKVLQKELEYRLNYVDLVLTVSEIEASIEKWIGAKAVFMVPRVLKNEFIDWNPVGKRVGFIGDISHFPNYYGLLKICEELARLDNEVELRIVGKDNSNVAELKKKFAFITHLGYLDEKAVVEEAATWNYFLNLVFYYSKGVSTKLAQGLNWGLPVISTTPGNRGYELNKPIPTFDKPEEMARNIATKLNNKNAVVKDRDDVLYNVQNSCTYQSVMNDLSNVLESL